MFNFKKLKFTKKYFFIFGIVIFLLFLSSITVYALNIWNLGYRIYTQTKEVKVGSSQACHKVTNTSSNSYFIPTKTTTEWNAFANNPPSGVTIGSCCTPGLCKLCPGPTMPADDFSCGIIDCDGLNYYYTSGSASVTGTNYCIYRNYADITSNRCEGLGNCKDANTSDCINYSNSTVATCGICKYASTNCNNNGTCTNYTAGTSCGTNKECDGSGNCVSSCVSYQGNSCGGSSCVYAGTYNCSGSCTGTLDKPSGISCGTNKECDGSGNCVTSGRCSSFVFNKNCNLNGAVLWTQWGLSEAQCLAKCDEDNYVACCHREANGFCAGYAYGSVPINYSGVFAASCNDAIDSSCISSHYAIFGPGITSDDCPTAANPGWCIVGTQHYAGHYCSGGYLYVNCKEDGTNISGECCGIDTGYCSGDFITLEQIVNDQYCTAALYKAKVGPGYNSSNCPSRDASWCTVGTQHYVGHYCSGGYLYIKCIEDGLEIGGNCCGINTGYCNGDVISI